MAVKIRLKRFGKRGEPVYRIVALDESKRRQDREIEILGIYDPKSSPSKVTFNKERVDYWLSVGAQSSNTVYHLLKNNKK